MVCRGRKREKIGLNKDRRMILETWFGRLLAPFGWLVFGDCFAKIDTVRYSLPDSCRRDGREEMLHVILQGGKSPGCVGTENQLLGVQISERR